jgi:hypothetical protein
MSRGLLFFAFIIALATGLFFVATRALRTNAPAATVGTPNSQPNAMDEGKMALSNSNITGLHNNKTVWTIYAPTVTTTQHQSDTSFSGDVRAQLFTESSPRANLTTKLATYNDVAHVFRAPGDVDVHLFARKTVRPDDLLPIAEELFIKTSNIQWDVQQKLLQCPQSTHIKFPQGDLTVNNTQVHLETHAFEGKDIRARFRIVKDVLKKKT